jgi:hypothetical protein
MTQEQTQEQLNRMGLAMAQNILSTKPAFDLSTDTLLCPFCESKDLKDPKDKTEELTNIQHYYGCVFLTATLFKVEIKDMLNFKEPSNSKGKR